MNKIQLLNKKTSWAFNFIDSFSVTLLLLFLIYKYLLYMWKKIF
jgi:hypothetical protein